MTITFIILALVTLAGAIAFDNAAKQAIEATMNYLKHWLKA